MTNLDTLDDAPSCAVAPRPVAAPDSASPGTTADRAATPVPGPLHRWWCTRHADAGQATAEYALVLLGAAMVALILIGWATGSGAGRVGGLLDRVIDAITGSF